MLGWGAAPPVVHAVSRPPERMQEKPARSAEAGAAREPRRMPADVARLFDAYALVEAQDALDLNEAQYAKFVGRYRTLLETRRRHTLARLRLVQELKRLTRAGATPADEVVRARLKALDDHDAQAAEATAAARAQVEEVLSLKQRARFRVFETELERKKLELMGRARDAARPGGRRGPAP
jgi:uncharacterized protein YciI